MDRVYKKMEKNHHSTSPFLLQMKISGLGAMFQSVGGSTLCFSWDFFFFQARNAGVGGHFLPQFSCNAGDEGDTSSIPELEDSLNNIRI